MSTDQLFKELIREFFREFMELFYPEVAARLDFSRVTFLDKEFFTDLPEGSRREPDIAALVYTLEGEPDIIVIHVEVQGKRPADFPYRMFEYYVLFRLRRRLPVFPIVVYLVPGAGGLVTETYTESLFGTDFLNFTYNAIGLPDLEAVDYLEQPNPLAPALSALMRPGGVGDALRKAMILRQRAIIDQNEARQTLLQHLVEQYIPLNDEQVAEFNLLIEQPEYQEVKKMISPYEQRGIEIGLQQGAINGALMAMRHTLLRQMDVRFGSVPSSIRNRVEAISDRAELDALLERVVTAPNLEAMGLAH